MACRRHLRSHSPQIGDELEEGLATLHLIVVQIFAGNIVLGNFMCVNFLLVSVVGIFHATHNVSLKCVSLFQQLIDALRIGTLVFG